MSEEPSQVRRQLGDELKQMRELAGLTQADMVAQLNDAGHRVRSQPSLSRFENGHQLPSRAMVDAWAQITHAKAGVRDRALAYVEAAHGETRPWRVPEGEVHLQGIAGRREEESRRIRDCSLNWIPGLCQTAEYARLLIPQVDPEQEIDHAAAVVARIERQQILYREGRRFEFLIAEHALLWQPGPGVMAGQRAKLTTIAELSDVELRVLASARVGAPEWTSFVIYDPADGSESFLADERLHGGQVLSDAKTLAKYTTLWDQLWSAAVQGEDALALMSR